MSQTPYQPQQPPVVNYATPAATAPPPKSRGLFGWVLFIGLAVMLFIVLQSNKGHAASMPLSDVYTQLKNGNVAEVIVDGDTLRVRLVAPVNNLPSVNCRAELAPGMGSQWPFVEWLMEHRNGATLRLENNPNVLGNILLPVVPWLLIFLFIWFFIFRQLRRQSTQPQPKAVPVYLVNPEQQQ